MYSTNSCNEWTALSSDLISKDQTLGYSLSTPVLAPYITNHKLKMKKYENKIAVLERKVERLNKKIEKQDKDIEQARDEADTYWTAMQARNNAEYATINSASAIAMDVRSIGVTSKDKKVSAMLKELEKSCDKFCADYQKFWEKEAKNKSAGLNQKNIPALKYESLSDEVEDGFIDSLIRESGEG